MQMHLEIYKKCPSVNAIIHAHPPHAIAVSSHFPYSILAPNETEESYIVAPYKTPASLELAEEVAAFAQEFNSFILERHGAVTTGATMQEAFDRIEMLEHACKVHWLVKALK